MCSASVSSLLRLSEARAVSHHYSSMQCAVVYSWFAVAPIVWGFIVGSFFCLVVLGVKQINVPSSWCFRMACDYAVSWSYFLAFWCILDTAAQTNLMVKRELITLLCLSSWCLVIIVWLFLAVPWFVCSL